MKANYPDDPELQCWLNREEESFQLADALQEELIEALEEELSEAYDRYERCYANGDNRGEAQAAKDIKLLEMEINECRSEM